MSEREQGNSTTWKAVRTLEYKKNQKNPKVERKGFGAILGEAQNVVTDKWTASGSLVPSYLNRLTEIQVQDEAYIHQQLVKPDEVKPKRGLQQTLSKSKGRGLRLLHAGASRKVRFNEDGHGRSSATGSFKPTRASGTGAEQLTQTNKTTSQPINKPVVSFGSSRAPAPASSVARGAALKPTLTTAAIKASFSPTPVPTKQLSPVPAAETGSRDLAAGNSAGSIHSTNGGGRTPPVTRTSRNSGSSSVSSGAHSMGLQDFTLSQHCQAPAGPATAANSTFSGDGGIMAKFLNQQCSEPVLLDLAPYATGSASGHWEGPSKTQLADKHLELLRSSTALPPAAAESQLDSPMGFRPLAIPEELFARWTCAAGSSGGSSSAVAAGAACGGAASRTPSSSRPPSRPRAAAAESSGGACQQHNNTGRRVSTSSMPGASATDQQQLLSSTRSGRDCTGSHSCSSAQKAQLVAAAAAAAAASDSAGKHATPKRVTRASGEHVTAAVAIGLATGSKQRLTADYIAGASSAEILSRAARKTGSTNSTAPSGSASPSQHPTSPRPRSSSSIHAQYSSCPGALASAPGGCKSRRATNTLPDLPASEHATPVQRSSSLVRSSMDRANAAAGDSSSSGRGSNPRGARMGTADSCCGSGSSGNLLRVVSDEHSHRRSPSSATNGPVAHRCPGQSVGGSADSSASGHNSSSNAGKLLGGVQKSNGKAVQLPGIGRTQVCKPYGIISSRQK